MTKADQEGCSTENYQIADGTICGSLQATDNGNEFKSFQGMQKYDCWTNSKFVTSGLPYAAPPVGNLRFLKPAPVETWDGVLDLSTKSTVTCIQTDKSGLL